MNKCISNKTNNLNLKIGNNYQLFKHEDPKLVWVKLPIENNSVGYITIQAYSSDFQSIESWRENVINQILE
jgi:hypothetical protein